MKTSASLAAILLLLLPSLACSRLGGGAAADEEEAAKAPSAAPAIQEDWKTDECKGEEYAVLSPGDPLAPGEPFVVRFRWQPKVVVPPHTHPVDEHVTVISGAVLWGMGETYSPTKGRLMTAGSYASMPTPMPHFATVQEEITVVQIHGVGPFTTKWLGDACEPSGEEAGKALR